MDKLKYVKLEQPDGSYSDSIPLAVDADHVDVNGSTLTNVLGNKADNTDIDNLQTEINSLASGSPKGSYATVSALVSDNPVTGVYVVQADGHLYSWTKDGSNAIDLGVYQAAGIADSSITETKIQDKAVNYDKLRFIESTEMDNFHNPNNVLADGKCWSTNGNPTTISGYYGTNKYKTTASKIYASGAAQVVCWDINGTFLGIKGPNSFTYLSSYNYNNVAYAVYEISLLENTYYFGINFANEKTKPVISNSIFSNYIEYGYSKINISDRNIMIIRNALKLENNTKNKKMNCMGDSITWGYTPGTAVQMDNPYPSILKDLLELSVCRNYGISGSRITTTGNMNPFVERYSDMDDDADIISIFGGTNDYAGSGSENWGSALGDISSTDNVNFYGALNNLTDGLITKYPDKKIFFITPLHRLNDNLPNARGVYLKEYVNAIKEVCALKGIPVLDLYSNCNIYPNNTTQKQLFMSDGLHPNQDFEYIMAQKIAKFIKSQL